MPEKTYPSIHKLLSSTSAEDLRTGLGLAKQELAQSGPAKAQPLFEMVSALFYLDPLDHPELMQLLNDAVNLVVDFGDRVIPALLDDLDAGDLKVQLTISHALGRMGEDAIVPLLAAYGATEDPVRRTFILYTLGKIKSPKIVEALATVLEATQSPDREVRDTATRALGKLAESIPAESLSPEERRACLHHLQHNLGDGSPSIRAKAIRSLGKLARLGYLTEAERKHLAAICQGLLGQDDQFDWDRAYIVRKEAKEALQHAQAQ